MPSRFHEEELELQERVIKYCKDTLDGTIPAGKPMLWAIQRFLDDLKKTNDSDYPYYMDWYELLKFYRWSKMFKHTKGILAGQPIELHDSQLFEFANILAFKRKSDGGRRFNQAYIQKARKNAIYLASL